MKKLKLEIDALRVDSFATQGAREARGTVAGRAGTADEMDEIDRQIYTLTFTEPLTTGTDTDPLTTTGTDTWGTGPCTGAPSSDFPCYTAETCDYCGTW